jgi:hypothetical protein
MLFKEELAHRIHERKKRQTRRPTKAGEKLVEINGLKTVLHANGRIKWQVGREYAVQYGYGLPTRLCHPTEGLMSYEFYSDSIAKHGKSFLKIADHMGWEPFRIRLSDIRFEDVRTISYADSVEEGFSGNDEFLVTWCGFYDTRLNPQWWGLYGEYFAHWTFDKKTYRSSDYDELQSMAAEYAHFSTWLMQNRPLKLYEAWALTF